MVSTVFFQRRHQSKCAALFNRRRPEKHFKHIYKSSEVGQHANSTYRNRYYDITLTFQFIYFYNALFDNDIDCYVYSCRLNTPNIFTF